MPNWCNNVVELVHADPSMLKRAARAFNAGALLQEFIPCPEELMDEQLSSYGGDDAADKDLLRESMLAKYGSTSWYDWRVANWGTKWDVGEENGANEDEETALILRFDSAWSPPIAAYEQLTEQGFHIDAYYYEPGMAFCGRWTHGDDQYVDIPATSREAEAVIPEEIERMFDIVNGMAMWEEDEEFEE